MRKKVLAALPILGIGFLFVMALLGGKLFGIVLNGLFFAFVCYKLLPDLFPRLRRPWYETKK